MDKSFSFVPVEVAESERVVPAISTSATATGLSLLQEEGLLSCINTYHIQRTFGRKTRFYIYR